MVPKPFWLVEVCICRGGLANAELEDLAILERDGIAGQLSNAELGALEISKALHLAPQELHSSGETWPLPLHVLLTLRPRAFLPNSAAALRISG